MEERNKMKLSIAARSENEAFARGVVAAFAAQLNPTVEELNDVKTAVSEAVTNAIVHGYDEQNGEIIIRVCIFEDDMLLVDIEDFGKGIEDIEKARQPFFTTCPEQERSGMGFTVMETFMDSLEVHSIPGRGTRVRMSKRFHRFGADAVRTKERMTNV